MGPPDGRDRADYPEGLATYLVDHWGWETLRSAIETHGYVDAEGWVAVLDLERALHVLGRGYRRGRHWVKGHPKAAAIVVARMHLDYGDRQMRLAFGEGWAKEKDRAIAFLSAFLSGSDPEEAWMGVG